MAEHDTPVDLAGNQDGAGLGSRLHGFNLEPRAETESSLILDVLAQCAATFGTDRARFVRRLSVGDWQVHTLQNGSLITHPADHAEIAMAWMVGLSRFPMRVTRPRVTHADGTGVRPIAVTSYLGIPVLCQDHFVGIIELAGSIKGDLERTLEQISGDINRFGERLTHDPALRSPQLIDFDVECWLDGGFCGAGDVEPGIDHWTVVSTIGGHSRLRDIADTAHLPEARVIDIVRDLVARGTVSVRATTRVLADDREPARFAAGITVDGGGQ